MLDIKNEESALTQIMNCTDHYTEKNWKVIGSMKIELGEKIMKKFVALKLIKYSSVKENCGENKN